jgi:hypothetical protein
MASPSPLTRIWAWAGTGLLVFAFRVACYARGRWMEKRLLEVAWCSPASLLAGRLGLCPIL